MEASGGLVTGKAFEAVEGLMTNRVMKTMRRPTRNRMTPGAASETVVFAPRIFALQFVDPVTPCRNRTIPPSVHASPRTRPPTE